MRNLLILLAAIMALAGSCDRITVGYLETAHAEYAPDTAVWKAVLDPALPEDPFQFGGDSGRAGYQPGGLLHQPGRLR